jgi:hypothetical protein
MMVGSSLYLTPVRLLTRCVTAVMWSRYSASAAGLLCVCVSVSWCDGVSVCHTLSECVVL